MSLHADAGDGHACLLHFLDHVVNAVALGGLEGVVVVIDEDGVGVGFVCELEGFGDEFVAAEFPGCAFAVGVGFLSAETASTGIAHGFVDYVPGIDHVFVAAHDGVDVFAQAVVEYFFGDGFAFFVGEHPVAELCVPAEAVSAHLDAVLSAEVGDGVGFFPGPFSFAGVHGDGFHVVFGGDAVVVFLDDFNLLGVVDVAHVDGYAHGEVSLVGVFVAFVGVGVGVAPELC